MTIPSFISDILLTIEHSGFEAFVVGGCVRDSILGKSPSDWDITTSALPEDIIRIFGSCRTIPTGIRHGTVTLVTPNGNVEITTFRIDGSYTDNRHPQSVTFSQNITDDLSRRDFTVNAIAYSARTGLVDPFDGTSDIRKKILRCVGDPYKRFQEDALRIMRALRFSAVLDFSIDKKTAQAILDCRHLLKNIAAERIATELSKLVLAENPQPVLKNYAAVFADILNFNPDKNLSRWEQNIQAMCRAVKDPAIRLSLLFFELNPHTSPAAILKSLKFDNKTIHTAKLLTAHLNTPVLPEPGYIKRLLSQIDTSAFELVLKAQLAAHPGLSQSIDKAKEIYNSIIAQRQCFRIKDLAVDGNDLVSVLGIKGKAIGNTLDRLLTAVINEECSNTYEALLHFAKNCTQ